MIQEFATIFGTSMKYSLFFFVMSLQYYTMVTLYLVRQKLIKLRYTIIRFSNISGTVSSSHGSKLFLRVYLSSDRQFCNQLFIIYSSLYEIYFNFKKLYNIFFSFFTIMFVGFLSLYLVTVLYETNPLSIFLFIIHVIGNQVLPLCLALSIPSYFQNIHSLIFNNYFLNHCCDNESKILYFDLYTDTQRSTVDILT